MFYRLTLTANFLKPPPLSYLRQIRDYIEANAITINEDEDNEEVSSYQVHQCFHDEDPNLPCELSDEWTS